MPRKRKEQPDNFFKAFPTAMRKLMLQKDITQNELAEYLHKTRQAVSYYCDGSSSPDWETLVKISDYFNVSTDYLLGRTADPNPTPAAVDDLGLSPKAVEWLHSINRASKPDKYGPVDRRNMTHKVNMIFENDSFQYLIENLCNLIDAAEAERIYYAVLIGAGRSQQIQQIIESHRYSDSVTDYLRAQYLLSGSTAPKEINDAFMFGINVTEVVAGDINRSLNGLLEDIRKMADEKTEKDTPGR